MIEWARVDPMAVQRGRAPSGPMRNWDRMAELRTALMTGRAYESIEAPTQPTEPVVLALFKEAP